MPYKHLVLLVVCVLLCDCHRSAWAGRAHPGVLHQFVFFGQERQGIHDPAFLAAKALEGAQLTYTWRELEPRAGAYDFSAVAGDLAFLTAHRKRLFLQLQDVTFARGFICVPKYLQQDAQYHGGADEQYDIPGEDDSQAVPAGWVARRWDPAVRERFCRLLLALGKAFDGRIEGINLPETAVEFGGSGRLFPKGFTPAAYRDGVLADMAALKRAFPRSVTLQYANFMPGEWLPGDDKGYLRSVYQRAGELKVGVGGPDLIPYRPGQMKHSYPLIRAAHGSIPTGVAVQDGDYNTLDLKTGKPTTIADLLDFAQGYLRVDYLFWCTQEPFYSRDLIPSLQKEPFPHENE